MPLEILKKLQYIAPRTQTNKTDIKDNTAYAESDYNSKYNTEQQTYLWTTDTSLLTGSMNCENIKLHSY
jgi:hypothetical protein